MTKQVNLNWTNQFCGWVDTAEMLYSISAICLGTTDEEWPIIVIATLISVGMVLLVAFIVGLLVVFYFWRRKQMQANEHK